MGFNEDVAQRAREQYCSNAIDTGIFVKNYGGILGGIPLLNAYLGARNAYRQFCDREPTPPPTYPYNGAQCPTIYQIDATVYDDPFDDEPFTYTTSLQVHGPILGFNYSSPPGIPPNGRFNVVCFGTPTAGPPTPTSVTQQYAQTIFSPERNPKFTVTVTSIRRIDGLPDNCGDSPNAPPASRVPPPVVDNDFTYIDNSGNSVSVPLIFAFGVGFLNLKGELNIPVKVTFSPTFDIPVSISPSFDINFNVSTGDTTYSPSYYDTDNPNDPGSLPSFDPSSPNRPGNYGPNTPVPPDPPDVPPPPPPPPDKTQEQVIRAVLVTVTNLPPNGPQTTIGQDVNPDVYVPDLGLVSFLIRVKGASGGWTEDIRIKNRRQFIPCPWEGGAIDVQATPRKGVQIVLTPIYGRQDVKIEAQ